MKRFALFAGAILIVVLFAFTYSRATAPRQRPMMRVTTRDGQVMEFPVTPGRANFDGTMASFLRQAMVAEEVHFSEIGAYTADVSKLQVTRPANTQLVIVKLGADGMRMSAINSKSQMQCDVFAGDSARWAFGYAFDPRKPACGKAQ